MPFDLAPNELTPHDRQATGLANYFGGLAAEDAVAQTYEIGGAAIIERRWRGKGGEVDLIARFNQELIFVEVKKSKTHAQAAERLSQRQLARIATVAEEYIAKEPQGALTPMRIDVALVDECGAVDRLENVMLGF